MAVGVLLVEDFHRLCKRSRKAEIKQRLVKPVRHDCFVMLLEGVDYGRHHGRDGIRTKYLHGHIVQLGGRQTRCPGLSCSVSRNLEYPLRELIAFQTTVAFQPSDKIVEGDDLLFDSIFRIDDEVCDVVTGFHDIGQRMSDVASKSGFRSDTFNESGFRGEVPQPSSLGPVPSFG